MKKRGAFVTFYATASVALVIAVAPSSAQAAELAGPSSLNAAASDTSAQRVAHLLTSAFSARITDTFRPMNAAYGAIHSYHKLGQAVDFVPAGGVNSITRAQIRVLMAANGIQILELLGPGDPGHSNHWHVAFARDVNVSKYPANAEPGPIHLTRSQTCDAPTSDVFATAGCNAVVPREGVLVW